MIFAPAQSGLGVIYEDYGQFSKAYLMGRASRRHLANAYQLVRSRLTFHIPKTRVIKSASHRMVMYFTDRFP